MTQAKKYLKKLLYVPSPCLNTCAKRNIARINEIMKNFAEPTLLNLGCGERFIGEKSLEKQRYKKIVFLDISLTHSVDVVGDAHFLPFKKSAFQSIICQAVLEHTRNPQGVVGEMYRLLKPEGIIYAEVPFLQGYHPSPSDYFRFTVEGTEQLFSEFIKIDLGTCGGPSSALSWILREYISGLLTGFSERKWLRKISGFISGWLTFPIKYLDIILSKRPGAHIITSGIYYLGKKG